MPTALPVNTAGIPLALRGVPRWVAWRYDYRQDGRWGKTPIDCRTGHNARVDDPSTWSDFDTAVAYYRHQRVDGIGFVFSNEDDIVGVDLDKCRDRETGQIAVWAERVVSLLASYSELSPSGTGIKVFLRASQVRDFHKKDDVEVYGTHRFFTVTGEHLPGTPDVVENREGELANLYDLTWKGPSDDECLQRARKKNPDKFDRLMAGDTSGYESQSNADCALCSLLFHATDGNWTKTKRLFEQSELAQRDKWKGRPDYQTRTLARAFRVTPIARPATPAPPPLPASQPTVRSLTDEQAREAVRIAVAVAEDVGDVEERQSMFLLTRKLMVIARDVDPVVFQPAITAFAERAQKDEEECWIAFEDCWPKTMLAEGDNISEWAVNMARKHPEMKPQTKFDVRYSVMVGVAAHLCRFHKGGPIFFAPEDLAGPLNTSPDNVYKLIQKMERNGIIKLYRKYDRFRHLSNEYLFTGLQPGFSDVQDTQENQEVSTVG